MDSIPVFGNSEKRLVYPISTELDGGRVDSSKGLSLGVLGTEAGTRGAAGGARPCVKVSQVPTSWPTGVPRYLAHVMAYRGTSTLCESVSSAHVSGMAYRGTSLIRNTHPAGPYSSPMPRDLW